MDQHSVEIVEMDQHSVEIVEMDQHFNCRAEVTENEEMDEKFVYDAETCNSIDYNQELVDDNSDTSVPKRINFRIKFSIQYVQ
jgi:hypothetical protein